VNVVLSAATITFASSAYSECTLARPSTAAITGTRVFAQDHDRIGSILRNPIERVDEVRMIACGEDQRPAVAVELDNQNAMVVSRQPQAAVGGEIIGLSHHDARLALCGQLLC
jgi:hypothetical protein